MHQQLLACLRWPPVWTCVSLLFVVIGPDAVLCLDLAGLRKVKRLAGLVLHRLAQRKLLILGHPGSGKSTILKYIALSLADAYLHEFATPPAIRVGSMSNCAADSAASQASLVLKRSCT